MNHQINKKAHTQLQYLLLQVLVLLVCLFFTKKFGYFFSFNLQYILMLVGIVFFCVSPIILIWFFFKYQQNFLIYCVNFLIAITFNLSIQFPVFDELDIIRTGKLYDDILRKKIICNNYNHALKTLGFPVGMQNIRQDDLTRYNYVHYDTFLPYWFARGIYLTVKDGLVIGISSEPEVVLEHRLRERNLQQQVCVNL